MHISYTKSFNIPVSFAFATLAYMINVYEICLNTTNYPIFNMQGFIYCLWTSILKQCWSAGIPTMHIHQMYITICMAQYLWKVTRVQLILYDTDNGANHVYPVSHYFYLFWLIYLFNCIKQCFIFQWLS